MDPREGEVMEAGAGDGAAMMVSTAVRTGCVDPREETQFCAPEEARVVESMTGRRPMMPMMVETTLTTEYYPQEQWAVIMQLSWTVSSRH